MLDCDVEQALEKLNKAIVASNKASGIDYTLILIPESHKGIYMTFNGIVMGGFSGPVSIVANSVKRKRQQRKEKERKEKGGQNG